MANNHEPLDERTSLYAQTGLIRDTLAVILAGGRGSRLGPLTRRRAKPAVPFGGKFRIIDFPLSNCINSGVRRIAVVTQYMAQSLLRHTQEGWNFLDVRVSEFVEAIPAQSPPTISGATSSRPWYAAGMSLPTTTH